MNWRTLSCPFADFGSREYGKGLQNVPQFQSLWWRWRTVSVYPNEFEIRRSESSLQWDAGIYTVCNSNHFTVYYKIVSSFWDDASSVVKKATPTSFSPTNEGPNTASLYRSRKTCRRDFQHDNKTTIWFSFEYKPNNPRSAEEPWTPVP